MGKILIVDDSESMRQMISFTLENAGYNVELACDGADGLKKAKSAQYALVLSDINMPIMDGIELIKQLRALAEYKGIPILILTTESSDGKKQEGKSAGATGWLVKPFEPDKLIATVKKVLG